MTTLIWDERRAGGWDQCSECSYLMVLMHGGKRQFPLGAYTDAERDALTATEVNRTAHRNAGWPMFDIINPASQKRYGVKLRPVSGSYSRRSTDTQLRNALLVPGNCVALPGTYLGLPYGNPLRARAREANGSDYRGGHMVAVANREGQLYWGDPLRQTGESFYPCTVGDAMAFAFANNDAHFARLNEFKEEDVVNDHLKGLREVHNRRAIIKAGATARSTPAFNPRNYNENRLFSLGSASSATMYGWVTGTNLTLSDGKVLDASTEWFVTREGRHGINFWHKRDLERLVPIEAVSQENTQAYRTVIERALTAAKGIGQTAQAQNLAVDALVRSLNEAPK